jgi:hypothetical protein
MKKAKQAENKTTQNAPISLAELSMRVDALSESVKFNNAAVQQGLIIADYIKYNLYLLSKSVVFSAITTVLLEKDNRLVGRKHSADELLILAAETTNKLMQELDLDTKNRLQSEEEKK